MQERRKIIAVDALKLSQPLDGVGNFLFNALTALAKNQSYIFLLFTPRPLLDNVAYRLSKYPNVRIEKIKNPVLSQNGLAWMMFWLPKLLFKFKPDFFWAPALLYPWLIPSRTKVIATVHDLVYIDYPETMGWKNHLVNWIYFKRSLTNADYLWSVSEYTKRRICSYSPSISPERIFVGSSISFEKFQDSGQIDAHAIRRLELSYNIKKPFLLFVGTIEPRKNLKFLLELLPLMPSQLNLVIVGSKGWEKSSVLTSIINKPDYPRARVKFTGYVPDKDLVTLYKSASAFVSCSINEGFGLPQLEAIYCGCPVVCPNNSAMSEVVDGCGVLVDGWDKEDWVKAIADVIVGHHNFQQARENKLMQYDWNRISDNLFLFIERCTNSL